MYHGLIRGGSSVLKRSGWRRGSLKWGFWGLPSESRKLLPVKMVHSEAYICLVVFIRGDVGTPHPLGPHLLTITELT